MRHPLVLAAALLAAAPALAQTRTDPPGNALERTYDRATGSNTSGALPQNRRDPAGTAAERAADKAAGTNSSGAYPRQSDGRPGNPPGTAVGREIDRQTR